MWTIAFLLTPSNHWIVLFGHGLITTKLINTCTLCPSSHKILATPLHKNSNVNCHKQQKVIPLNCGMRSVVTTSLRSRGRVMMTGKSKPGEKFAAAKPIVKKAVVCIDVTDGGFPLTTSSPFAARLRVRMGLFFAFPPATRDLVLTFASSPSAAGAFPLFSPFASSGFAVGVRNRPSI